MTMDFRASMECALVVAGVGQLVLCLASPAIPVVLGWREKVACLPKLERQIFWTYACYVLGAHLVFAVLSIAGAGLLLTGEGLAVCWTGFIGAWWGVRLLLHLTTFDTGGVPEGIWTRLAELGLGLLFAGLTIIYGTSFVMNLKGGL